MEYLKKVLGIEVTYGNMGRKHFPNFISSRYHFQMVSLDGKRVVFIYPDTELEQIAILKKHISRIQEVVDLPCVLVIKELTYRQKEYLIREKIPFVVDGKQIYLPFMAVYLQEQCTGERVQHKGILPSAQMLLLYFIYKGAQEMSTSQAAKDLGLTPTSISRASKQLQEMGLVRIKKSGVQRILLSADSPQELFSKAKDKLLNPVKKRVYIPRELAGFDLLESGYSALSEYSMLNAPKVKCYATDSISQWKDVMTNRLQDSQTQVAVEMWRYDPGKLSDGNVVDELSLALAMKDDPDERVEEAVEEMIDKLWGRKNDNRN